MEPFLKKFFPSVYKKMIDESGRENQYCKFDSQLLTLFTSSLYLAALAASFGASVITRSFGRKVSMLIGGVVFFVGSILNGAATNMEMLIIGRLLLGVGVGFANQVFLAIIISNPINLNFINMLCSITILYNQSHDTSHSYLRLYQPSVS